jgi:NADH:ubiquinone oxidoreductase subunit 2 (subunit N)
MSKPLQQVVPDLTSELKLRAPLLVAVVILFAFHFLQIAAAQPFGWPSACENCPYYSMKLVVTTINMILLLMLLAMYVSAYRETKSEFLVGLIIFDLAMFFYAVTSNPLVHIYFGFHEIGPGPFIMLPDIFSLVAVVVLLVQAFRYR